MVEIKNQRWYGDTGNGAVWFDTLDNNTGTISKASWEKFRVGMGCTDAQTISEIKREIEQLCSQAGQCSYEMQQTIHSFEALGAVTSKAALKK